MDETPNADEDQPATDGNLKNLPALPTITLSQPPLMKWLHSEKNKSAVFLPTRDI